MHGNLDACEVSKRRCSGHQVNSPPPRLTPSSPFHYPKATILPGIFYSIFSNTFTTIHRHRLVKKTKAGCEVKWPCPEEDHSSAVASTCSCWYVRLCVVARAMPRAIPFFPPVLSSFPHILDHNENLFVRMRFLVLLPSHRHPRPPSLPFPHPRPP